MGITIIRIYFIIVLNHQLANLMNFTNDNNFYLGREGISVIKTCFVISVSWRLRQEDLANLNYVIGFILNINSW